MYCFLLDPVVFRVQMCGVQIWFVSTTNVLHQLAVGVLSGCHCRQIVCLCRRHQHALRFGQFVTLVDSHVGLEVLDQIPCFHFLTVDFLRYQIRRRQQHRHQVFEALFELGRNICQPTVELLVRGNRQSRMRHQEASNFREAGGDVTSEGLQFGVLFVLDFQASLQNHVTAFGTVFRLVREAPVSN